MRYHDHVSARITLIGVKTWKLRMKQGSGGITVINRLNQGIILKTEDLNVVYLTAEGFWAKPPEPGLRV